MTLTVAVTVSPSAASVRSNVMLTMAADGSGAGRRVGSAHGHDRCGWHGRRRGGPGGVRLRMGGEARPGEQPGQEHGQRRQGRGSAAGSVGRAPRGSCSHCAGDDGRKPPRAHAWGPSRRPPTIRACPLPPTRTDPPTAWRARPAPICSSTRTTRSTGIRGARRPSRGPGAGPPDLPLDRLRGLPLVPRDGARVVRGPDDRGGAERVRSCPSRWTARSARTWTRSTWTRSRR